MTADVIRRPGPNQTCARAASGQATARPPDELAPSHWTSPSRVGLLHAQPAREWCHVLPIGGSAARCVCPSADVRLGSFTSFLQSRASGGYPRPRNVNIAAQTSFMPSVLRFPRSLTNPTCRLARGLSGATIVFLTGKWPAPKLSLGTTETPSPTATRLLIASTLSNSMTGLGGGPAGASQSVTARRSAEFSLPRIRGHRERNAGVTFFGTGPTFAGRMATSSSLKSGTVSNAGSSIGIAHRPRSSAFIFSICRVVVVRPALRRISSWG
jgi:hypothetical protein